MTSQWLEPSTDIDTDAIQHEVEQRLKRRMHNEEIGALAVELRKTMLPDFASDGAMSDAISLTEADCDIVPRAYVIDWQHPLLGPINARVRQVINAEVRRYLSASLEQQSFVNRQLLQLIKQLQSENAELRRMIEALSMNERDK